jgi:hypothetical protein
MVSYTYQICRLNVSSANCKPTQRVSVRFTNGILHSLISVPIGKVGVITIFHGN